MKTVRMEETMLSTVVLMKICPDTAELKADPQTRAPRLANVPLRISTFDENALEEAIRLKEKHGGQVATLSLVAEKPPDEILLQALAMGADEAYLIEDRGAGEADSLATATILAAALARLGDWDLVFCGEGSLDLYNRQVGCRLAEELAIPFATQVTEVEVTGRRVVLKRALEDRTETVESPLPALLAMGQEINQPRYPSVLQIMGASRKPRTIWGPEELGFAAGTTAADLAAVKTLEIFAPTTSRRAIAVEGESSEVIAQRLCRALFQEGLV